MFALIMSKPDLTPDQIDAIARDWFNTALEVDEEQRLTARPGRGVYTQPSDPLNETPVDTDVDLLGTLECEAREAVASNDLGRARQWVEACLAEAGAQADPNSLTYKRLAHALLRANAEFYRVAAGRRAGNYAIQLSIGVQS